MGLLESELCEFMHVFSKNSVTRPKLLMIGKQDILCKTDYLPVMVRNFQWQCDPEYLKSIPEKQSIDSFELFRALGFSVVDAVDYSDYEGANIIHDMNYPIPKEYFGGYDYVLNGGTLEHIFNISTAMDNLSRLVKPGGYICHIAPSDGWVDHGFFSISPTFFRDYYEANDFRIERLDLEIVCDEQKEGVHSYFCGDMRLLGSSGRMNRFIRRRLKEGDRALIFCIAEKLGENETLEAPIQGLWRRIYEDAD